MSKKITLEDDELRTIRNALFNALIDDDLVLSEDERARTKYLYDVFVAHCKEVEQL